MARAGTERWGVLGGTFDPPHVAHVVAATVARHALGLDRVLLVVAADPWQKRGDVVAPAADRLDLVRAVCDDVDGIEASAIEVERGGPTYTVDTLESLSSAGRTLSLVVGADVAARLDTWHRAEHLAQLCELAVVDRADASGAPPDALGLRVTRVSMPRLDVTSTELRRRLADGAPVDGLVPPPAIRLIRERGLYTSVR